MTYFGELRRNARPLVAACLGSGTSLPLFAYTNSVFAPHLVAQFGWSRAQFALIGLTMFATLLVLPVIGRVTDKLGVRRVALTGTLLLPLCFLGYAAQQGDFIYFAVVSTATLMVGSLTSPLVYNRLVAENFTRATGLAFTVVNCVPAVLAIGLVPILNWWIEAFGWRSAYIAIGVVALLAGLGAIALIPKGTGRGKEPEAGVNLPDEPMAEVHRPAGKDYKAILSSREFWVIFFGFFLCVLQTPLHASQMNLMLIDNAISTQTAANIVTIYAAGTVVGRIACGLALDKFPTPPVTAISLILPALGFFLLATDLNTVGVIAFAMFLVGLSVGAESDLTSYLVARYFRLRIYNTTLGLVFFVTFLGSGLGAVGISRSLAWFDSFSPYLYFVSGSVALGSVLFLLLPWSRNRPQVG